MPSIAGFIHSLLSEDMYATGMLEKMDDRISQLNAGQLRLLVEYVQNKVPTLTNKTVLDAHTKLLRKANAETEKRHEEEVRGERERLMRLKAAHAGVNAKAWDTSHASLDRELAKFQKFLKSKARRVAEEQVLQEEMEKLHSQLLAVPARRVAADTRRHTWWALGAVLVVVVGPILVLCLLPVGALVAVAAFLAMCGLAAVCWFVGMLRGIVVMPALDDDAIEDKTRKRAKDTLKEYRAEVRRTFEATEKVFAADMKWRDDWVESRRQERRNERRNARKALKQGEQDEGEGVEGAAGRQGGGANNSGRRIVPVEEGERDGDGVGRAGPTMGDRRSTGPALRGSGERIAPEEGGDSSSRVMVQVGGEARPLLAGASAADQCHNPENKEEEWGTEEGLPTGSPGKDGEKQVPENVLESDSGGSSAAAGGSSGVMKAPEATVGGEPAEARKLRDLKACLGEEEERADPGWASTGGRTGDPRALEAAKEGGVEGREEGEPPSLAAAAAAGEDAEGSQRAAIRGEEPKGDTAA